MIHYNHVIHYNMALGRDWNYYREQKTGNELNVSLNIIKNKNKITLNYSIKNFFFFNLNQIISLFTSWHYNKH